MDDVLSIVLNDRGLFNFEHLRQKAPEPAAPAPPAEVEKKKDGGDGGWFGIFGKHVFFPFLLSCFISFGNIVFDFFNFFLL